MWGRDEAVVDSLSPFPQPRLGEWSVLTWPLKHVLLKVLKQRTQQETEEGLVSQEETKRKICTCGSGG